MSGLPNLDQVGGRGSGRSSNLGNLFGDSTGAPNGDAAFQYTPTRAPSNTRTSQPSQSEQNTSAMSLLYATPITLFKFDSSTRQFAKVGKLGAAILGNVVSSQFQLLVYYTKQKHLLSLTITSDFAYTVQSNLYGSFKDASGNHWSMLFDSQESADGFARQVALTRCLAAPSDTIITLDLDVPKAAKGRPVESGDTIGCAYKGYLEENGKVGRVFDENPGKPKPYR
eukprot:CAMPEP_0177639610 /NCGR_PEP_ID=MMETSP0447-20121125/6112_1 /TAXON_ID=0 /ORGANISM="Stygamoeba regulata, Strain BSH-02190019" /LENGTH=225 /DNA_ID=CAMNT_0019141647 /DNA_START=190 /DNA_END=863 /DNA_ORIENTATION=+